VHRAVCLYMSQLSPVLIAPRGQKNGQAELTWVAGYKRRRFVRLRTPIKY